jgi:hypothetical protein
MVSITTIYVCYTKEVMHNATEVRVDEQTTNRPEGEIRLRKGEVAPAICMRRRNASNKKKEVWKKRLSTMPQKIVDGPIQEYAPVIRKEKKL